MDFIIIVILIVLIIYCIYTFFKQHKQRSRKHISRKNDIAFDYSKNYDINEELRKEAEDLKRIKCVEDCPYASEIKSYYELNNLEKYKHNFYKVSGANRQIAIKDVLYLNKQIVEAHNLYSDFQLVTITSEPFYNELQRVDYCHYFTLQLSFPERTKSGKLPKHPVILHFWCNRALFGKISYNHKGEVSRSEIMVRQDSKCLIIISTLVEDEFNVKYIYKSDDYRKIKIFERGK